MTAQEIDALRRELLIAAAAARKLSVALNIAWAELTNVRFSNSLRPNERAMAPADDKDNAGAAEPSLPF